MVGPGAGRAAGGRGVIPRPRSRGQAGLPEPPARPKIAGVDHSLLRSWLGLPPGPWPPDHYALLGLPPGSSDPAAVEVAALERMARLRQHQLLHPELVTEGMNRLAQALVCLTDPAARAAYEAQLGLTPAVVEAPSPRPPEPPPLPYEVVEKFPGPTALPPPADVTQVIEVAGSSALAPAPLPFEVVDDGPAPRPPYEVVPEPVVEALVVAPPRSEWKPASRRQLYARLVRLRRLREAWEKLKPSLGDPREPLDRPVRVLAFLEAIAEVRPVLAALAGLVGEPWLPGGLVAAVVRQPLSLQTVRALLPDQRRAVALDWRKADEELARETVRLRELSRSGRKFRPRFRRRGRAALAVGWALGNPETLLLALAAAVAVAALIRSSAGR